MLKLDNLYSLYIAFAIFYPLLFNWFAPLLHGQFLLLLVDLLVCMVANVIGYKREFCLVLNM